MAVDRASDNPFPSVLFAEHVDPSNPDAGYKRLFVDTDHIMKTIDSSGTIVQLGQGLTDPMTTRGDIIIRDASNVTARLAKGSADTYLGSDGTDVSYSAVTDAKLSMSDITTNNASTSKHGFLKKLDNDSTHFMDGTGAWAVPATAAVTASSCRAYNSATQSIADNTAFVALNMDTEEHDDATYHFTSAANLTGTVAKTASSTAVVGTGTSFTTELTVGQVISVPGTAAEKRTVTVITDNTHLTVNSNFANSASGQTAARVNSAFVAITAGTYGFAASTTWDTNTTNRRIITISKNGTQIVGRQIEQTPIAAGLGMMVSLAAIKLAQWDFLEAVVYQNSGGARNAGAAGGGAASAAEFVRLGS